MLYNKKRINKYENLNIDKNKRNFTINNSHHIENQNANTATQASEISIHNIENLDFDKKALLP